MSIGELKPGSALGDFRVVRLLGQGGMAAVYEATAPSGERVALKVLHDELSDDPDVRARFQREARMAAKVSHPHIAGGRGMHEIQGNLVLEMEFLEGETLAALSERLGPMDLGVLAEVMLPIVSALQAVHNAGIVHRDVKPENIFLAKTRDGGVSPRLLDFGISKLTYGAGTAITQASTTLGTVSYMSPEQASGRAALDARTDQYALGVVLYECATGAMPFFGRSLMEILSAILSGTFTRPSAVRPSIPESFDAVVLRAMAREPDARFPELLELGRGLLPFLPEASRRLWAPTFQASAADDPPEIQSLDLEATLSTQAMESLMSELAQRASDERVTVPKGIGDSGLGAVERRRDSLVPAAPPPPEESVVAPPSPAAAPPSTVASPPAETPIVVASTKPNPADEAPVPKSLIYSVLAVLLGGLGVWLLTR